MPEPRIKLYRGRYYAAWIENGRTRRAALRTDNRAEAERQLADFGQKRIGDLVGDIMNAYLTDLEKRAARPDRPKDAWKSLKPHFAHLRPDQIDRDICRKYTRKRIAAGRKPGTINKELGILRSALRWKDKNTPAVFELPSPPDPVERHLTRKEYERLLDGCHAPHVKLFVVLALATAGRATAILELTWSRVDFSRKQIRLKHEDAFRRKGRATVPMTARALAELQAAAEVARTPYVIEYGDKPVKKIRKAFARACERAGLDGVTPHTLRHTAAVWMAENGSSMKEIADYLGHGDERTTSRIYARFSPDHLRKAASALEV